MAMESHCDEHGKEIWEVNWMDPEVQTTLLNAYPPKLMATILKARMQLKRLQTQHQKSRLNNTKS